MTPTHAGKNIESQTGYSSYVKCQVDFLKPCPFCGGAVVLHDKFDGSAETTFVLCTKCNMWFEKFDWRGYSERHIIEEWNRRVKE